VCNSSAGCRVDVLLSAEVEEDNLWLVTCEKKSHVLNSYLCVMTSLS
jgi:hypothetical protein